MTKKITTIEELIRWEWINRGNSEFEHHGRLVPFEPNFQIVRKIARYDNDIHTIVTDIFFEGEKLNSTISDKHFKKAWVNRFMQREPKFQTQEAFTSMNIYTFLTYQEYLNRIYDDLQDYLDGLSNSESESGGDSTSDSRTLMSTLPQDEINLNVDNTVLDYGDSNVIARTKNRKDDEGKTTSRAKSLDALLKTENLLEPIFTKFDKKCFLQIW